MTDEQFLMVSEEDDTYNILRHILDDDLHDAYYNNLVKAMGEIAAPLDLENRVQIRAWYDLYLICSFAYYRYDVSLITDSQFDQLCVKLLALDDDFVAKYLRTYGLYDRDALRAGTGYHIKEIPYFPFFGYTMLMERQK